MFDPTRLTKDPSRLRVERDETPSAQGSSPSSPAVPPLATPALPPRDLIPDAARVAGQPVPAVGRPRSSRWEEFGPADTRSDDFVPQAGRPKLHLDTPPGEGQRHLTVCVGVERAGAGFRGYPEFEALLAEEPETRIVRRFAEQLGDIERSLEERRGDDGAAPREPFEDSTCSGSQVKAPPGEMRLSARGRPPRLPEINREWFSAEVRARLGEALYAKTIEPLSEAPLPPAVHIFLDGLAEPLARGRLTVARAEREIRAFLRENYVYDLSFARQSQLNDVDFRIRDAAQHHIELIHATPPPGKLGRGVCVQLNTLKLEMLRHLQIPAVMVRGFLVRSQSVGEEDRHQWAGIPVPADEPGRVRLFPSESGVSARDTARPEPVTAEARSARLTSEPDAADWHVARAFLRLLQHQAPALGAPAPEIDGERLRGLLGLLRQLPLQSWISRAEVPPIRRSTLQETMRAAGLSPSQQVAVLRALGHTSA